MHEEPGAAPPTKDLLGAVEELHATAVGPLRMLHLYVEPLVNKLSGQEEPRLRKLGRQARPALVRQGSLLELAAASLARGLLAEEAGQASGSWGWGRLVRRSAGAASQRARKGFFFTFQSVVVCGRFALPLTARAWGARCRL